MVKPLSASCVNTVVACSEEIDNSERIDPHPNQKQELIALLYMHVLFMVVWILNKQISWPKIVWAC